MERTTFNLKFLNQLVTTENSCIEMVTHKRAIIIEPHHGIHLTNAIKQKLDRGIGKYDSQIKGLVLAYKNVKILSNVANLDYEGFYNLKILVNFFVFKPVPGKTLQGVVQEKDQDLVACLVYKTFIVSLMNSEEGNNWAGNNVEIGQKITFRVKFVNLTSGNPYIQGEFLENLIPTKRKIRFSDIMETEENGPDNIIESEPVKKSKKSRKKSNHENSLANESGLLENSLLNGSIKLNNEPEEKGAENIIENEPVKKKKKSRRSQDSEETMENELVNKSKKSGRSSNHENSLANESGSLENSLLNGSIKLNNEPEEEPVKKKKKSRRSQDPDETMENELVNKKTKKSHKSSNHENSLTNESELPENSLVNGGTKLSNNDTGNITEIETVKKKKKSCKSQDEDKTMEIELVNKKRKKSRDSLENSMDDNVEQVQKKPKKRKTE